MSLSFSMNVDFRVTSNSEPECCTYSLLGYRLTLCNISPPALVQNCINTLTKRKLCLLGTVQLEGKSNGWNTVSLPELMPFWCCDLVTLRTQQSGFFSLELLFFPSSLTPFPTLRKISRFNRLLLFFRIYYMVYLWFLLLSLNCIWWELLHFPCRVAKTDW